MNFEIAVDYTEAVIRNAAKRFLVWYAIRELVAGASMVLVALALLACGVAWQYCAMLGVPGVGLIAVFLFAGTIYTRSSMDKFRMMRNKTVLWRFTEDTLGTRSDLGTTEIPWQSVSDIWCFPEVWLIFFGTQGFGYSTLPTKGLNREMKEFILSRVGLSDAKTP